MTEFVHVQADQTGDERKGYAWLTWVTSAFQVSRGLFFDQFLGPRRHGSSSRLAKLPALTAETQGNACWIRGILDEILSSCLAQPRHAVIGLMKLRWEMSIIGWIILGLVAGFIASKIVNKSGEGLIVDIVLGIIGAFVGGFLFNLVGQVGVTGFNLWSMIVAVVGAIVVLLIYHAVFRRTA